ncbi:hypothetical protein [Denitrobaculum tricleocarpae]|uniref:Uncharacterized protein n=1 Tax=Denitrobaculum tricleocarpae TaxID=2591009 RepID=A0A545TPL8_9PROT|nr:hypothetical protein [Denitrobaculum tricleocarpae]TQV79165.1 hypothetical protein FKG95_16000 [Denitrobaculum tricleocarpae]
MSDLKNKQRARAKVAAAEDDRALKIVMIGFLGLIVFAASALAAFPSMGAVFVESYKQQYQAKVTEAVICRF